MCRKLIWPKGLVILALAAAAPICSAAVGPVTGITTDNPPGSPPYNILSITVGSYTVTVDRLATGTTTHGSIGGTPCPEMDDWDINTALDWNLGGGDYWTISFGGGPWKNSNGDNPDFFLFEYGGSQTPDIAAILPGGGLGQTVTIPDQWANLGYSRVAAASGDPVSGSGDGQSLEGMSWAITDLLDAAGNPLTNNSVIEGIAIVNRNGIDPIGFFAVVGDAPEPEPVRQLDADGLVVIEAELYDDIVPSAEFEFVFNTDFDGYSRAGCMRSLPSGTNVSSDASRSARLDYQVEFKQAGMVYVWG